MSGFIPVRLAFTCIEPEDGVQVEEPVIFLHGMTQSQISWKDIPTTVANATGRKVYVVDARNHGDSEWSDDFSFDLNCDDLLHFMNDSDISRAVLVGHSMGAFTAYKAALRDPERVSKVFSEDMTAQPLQKQFVGILVFFMGLLQEAIKSMPAGLDEAGAKKFIKQHFYNNMQEDVKKMMNIRSVEDIKDEATDIVPTSDGRFRSRYNIDVVRKVLATNPQFMSELKGTYEGPVCIACGTLSPLGVSRHAEEIKAIFPNAELVDFEGATHNVHIEKPKEFVDLLLKFIS